MKKSAIIFFKDVAKWICLVVILHFIAQVYCILTGTDNPDTVAQTMLVMAIGMVFFEMQDTRRAVSGYRESIDILQKVHDDMAKPTTLVTKAGKANTVKKVCFVSDLTLDDLSSSDD